MPLQTLTIIFQLYLCFHHETFQDRLRQQCVQTPTPQAVWVSCTSRHRICQDTSIRHLSTSIRSLIQTGCLELSISSSQIYHTSPWLNKGLILLPFATSSIGTLACIAQGCAYIINSARIKKKKKIATICYYPIAPIFLILKLDLPTRRSILYRQMLSYVISHHGF